MAFDISPAWGQVSPALKQELAAFWQRHNVLADPALAASRAEQAVCIGRDDSGALCAVGTAELRTLPRLRQPMYYYRQFFAKAQRGRWQAAPFARRAKEILQAYNATLPAPESLGMLIELESKLLDTLYTRAYAPKSDYTFIGYSQRGLQLRVSYFEGATLLKRPGPAAG